MQASLTVVVVTLNEADKLSRCLRSVKPLQCPILVIDLKSTDGTGEVAKKAGARLITHAPVTIVEKVREWSLKQVKSEYVLFLDPDEELSPALAKEIGKLVSAADFDYCQIPRQNLIFGRWLQHSRWWPDYQVRLFRQGAVKWPTSLHLQPAYRGISRELEATKDLSLIHHNYANLDEWFDKNRRYAKQEAQDRYDSERPFRLTEAVRLSVSELISRYFAAQGYRDGLHGLMLSVLQSFYYFLVYAYYWELSSYKELEAESTVKAMPHQWFSHGLSEVIHWDSTAKGPLKRIKRKLVRRMIA